MEQAIITKSPQFHYSSASNNNKFPSIFHLLLLLLFFIPIPNCHSESNHTALIYHHCSSRNQTPTSHQSQTLLKSLITNTKNSRFHRATTAQNGIPISAEYQCRGDMSFPACQTCVTHSGILSNRLCAGAQTARVQLRGCYIRYYEEADGDSDNDGDLATAAVVLHKGCEGGYYYHDDGRARDGALLAVEEGVARSGNGFSEARIAAVTAVAQCEFGLLGCDCAECVSRAVEVVREECGGRVAGEVYLVGCYVSYTTNPYSSGYQKNGGTRKLVAILLGGAASLGLGFILLLFFKSCGKKDDD